MNSDVVKTGAAQMATGKLDQSASATGMYVEVLGWPHPLRRLTLALFLHSPTFLRQVGARPLIRLTDVARLRSLTFLLPPLLSPYLGTSRFSLGTLPETCDFFSSMSPLQVKLRAHEVSERTRPCTPPPFAYSRLLLLPPPGRLTTIACHLALFRNL